MVHFEEEFLDLVFYDINEGVVGTQSELKFLLDLRDLLSDKKVIVHFFNYTDFSIRYYLEDRVTFICCKEYWRKHLENSKSLREIFDKFIEIVENDSLYTLSYTS